MPLRARAALGLATWMALMWNTPWLENLCSCSVRPVKFDESTSVAVLKRTEHEPDGCCDAEFHRHQHLLLGVVLAEIALARPICVRRTSDSDKPLFVVFNTGRRDYAENVSSRILLKRVGDAVNSCDYEAAITYCFRMHEGLEHQTRPADTTMQYDKNVVRPLRRFHEHVHKVYEHGGKKMWDPWQEHFFRLIQMQGSVHTSMDRST